MEFVLSGRLPAGRRLVAAPAAVASAKGSSNMTRADEIGADEIGWEFDAIELHLEDTPKGATA